MKTTSAKAPSRVGLLGNPSDGFEGKAISFTFREFSARVTLLETNQIEISADDANVQPDDCQSYPINTFNRGEDSGASDLIQSSIIQFDRFLKNRNWGALKPFRVEFDSNIPFQVGLAGSSAIVVATLKAICSWHDVTIEPELLATMALNAELEIGIQAGLQDRVIQTFEGLMYMDFSAAASSTKFQLSYGQYQRLEKTKLRNVYVAFAENRGESTNVLHNDLKSRYLDGDPVVIQTLAEIAALAEAGKTAIQDKDFQKLSELIDRNFDLRRSICKLNPAHVELVEVARSAGASAKFCGSGGAIVGIFPDESTYARLESRLSNLDCTVFKPTII